MSRSSRLRKLFLLATLLLLASPAGAVIARVNGSGAFDNTGTSITSLAAPALNVTAGNLLVVCVRLGNTTATATISDTAGNTWTQAVTVAAADAQAKIFYAKNVLGNAANVVTVSFSPGAGFDIITVNQYSGADTAAPLDVTATGSGSGATATSGAFTTTNANEVIVAFGEISALNQVFTAGAGYTLENQENFGSDEDKIVSTIQTGVTASMTFSGSANNAIVVATFKAAAGGPPPCTPTLSLMVVGRCG